MELIEVVGWTKDSFSKMNRAFIFERKANRPYTLGQEQKKGKTNTIDLMLLTQIFHLLSHDYSLAIFISRSLTFGFVGIVLIYVQFKWGRFVCGIQSFDSLYIYT